MIRSLKKVMAPVLSDVSVEWVFPESTEVLVSPVSTSCLFPGDRLVSYGVICDTSPYLSNPRSVSLWGCSRAVGVCTRVLVRACLLLPSCVLKGGDGRVWRVVSG